jgi:hypothetical protein
MRHYAKVVRARLTTLLMLVVMAVAAVAGPASGKVMLADDKIMSDEEAERWLVERQARLGALFKRGIGSEADRAARTEREETVRLLSGETRRR